MCELKKAGFGKDCAMCESAFFETFTMCPDRDPNLTQAIYDEIHEDWEGED